MTREQKIYIMGLIELYKTSAEVCEKYYKDALKIHSIYHITDNKARELTYRDVVKDLEKFLEMGDNNND